MDLIIRKKTDEIVQMRQTVYKGVNRIFLNLQVLNSYTF